MKNTISIRPQEATQIPEPQIAKFLFADTRIAWLWLIVRLYVGYQWLTAGLEKLTGHDGVAIKGFVSGALAQATGAHPAVQGWYASFLQTFVLPHAAFFAYVVTFCEVLVGVAL